MVIAMHQPNFIPYMGFFQKMKEVELFVILKEVQYERQNYQNRFFYEGKWYTMSVNSGLEPIKDKRYVQYNRDWNKIVSQHPKLSVFNAYIHGSLAGTNINIIRKSAKLLELSTPIELDFPTLNTGTMRLIEICLRHKADTYLSGISGKKYLDLDMFKRFGIKVIFQDEKTMDKRPLIDVI